MTTTKKTLFITGATGYIGGSILTSLLTLNKYTISALVRSEEDAKKLTSLGVRPVLGSLDDTDLLFKESAASDIVLSAADADHFESVKAFVNGLKSGGNPDAVFLHTSGTGVLTHDKYTKVHYDDLDMQRIHDIPMKALHKNVDDWIFKNAAPLYFAIIAPSTINGIGNGPFRQLSQQIPNLVKCALEIGKAGYVGEEGDNITWGNVHILDLVNLYNIVLEGLVQKNVDYGGEGWYFGISSDYSYNHIAQRIGNILFRLGFLKTPQVAPFEMEYVHKKFGSNYVALGHESKGVANRGRKFGWKVEYPDVYSTLEEEIKYMIDNGIIKK